MSNLRVQELIVISKGKFYCMKCKFGCCFPIPRFDYLVRQYLEWPQALSRVAGALQASPIFDLAAECDLQWDRCRTGGMSCGGWFSKNAEWRMPPILSERCCWQAVITRLKSAFELLIAKGLSWLALSGTEEGGGSGELIRHER